MIVVISWTGTEERERNMNKDINLDTKKGLRKALLAVAEMLEANEIVHTNRRNGVVDVGIEPQPDQRNFNLEVSANSDYNCGTVACIGGWCWLLNKEEPVATEDGSIIYDDNAIERADWYVNSQRGKLEELFYPPFSEYFADAEIGSEDEDFWRAFSETYKTVTPAQTAKAIRNFVKNGDADWFSVMKNAHP
ncbi:hypothetical protein UFOVP1459_49 [uncultured Caudovirales phage]|uniref:Uncharacterized protein n=1 Tax=uncultured Caudovirales phage TaxID=2100421 RepID=A0A6J5SKG8_9CAUD|nr:hypothetical protein UFOVP1459_49 [uncultured Caudovirales phage]CAB4218491.1 hypothetical protein UFOVP1609_23 [uncultured Caudovirales phage]